MSDFQNTLDPGGGWSSKMRGSENFPSPFLDMASLAMPDNNLNALQWCEYIFSSNETLRMAIERIIAYFITDIEVGAYNIKRPLGDDEKEKWEQFFLNDLKILSTVQQLSRALFCYGNAFASLVVPFKRFLMCPRCRQAAYPLKTVHENPAFSFRFVNFEFVARCPQCKYSGAWTYFDEPENDQSRLKVKLWNPKEIVLLHSGITDEEVYYWNIPEMEKQQVREGKLFHLERTPKPILEAMRAGKLFKFAPGAIYHAKEHALPGLQTRGWGISRIITCFRACWYVQVLRRYNEAIALDYIIPFRLITPAGGGGATANTRDMLLSTNAGDFMGEVRSMIRKRRRNPAEWFTLPFPVDYQALGGDAQALAPRELLDQGMETLLNGIGTPVELYKGTLQLQTAPVAMRLFEATWFHLVYANNDFLRWLTKRVSAILSWENVSARHKRVSHADDMQRHMALLQLMMGGVISQTTGLRALGIDLDDESRLLADEARKQQKTQQDVQDEQATQAFGQQLIQGGGGQQQGQPPGGQGGGAQPQQGANGQPMPPPGPVTSMVQNNYMPQTPDDIMSQADSLAQQLLGLPESQKDSELRMLQQKNEMLHDLVIQKLDRIRNSARQQGGAQVMSQQFGTPPPQG